MHVQYARLATCYQQGHCAIFPCCGSFRVPRGADSKDCQTRAPPRAHDKRALKEGLDPMNPAQKALWFIESHLAGPLSLDEISDVAGVSRFHLVRAFAAATGFSVMRYVRVR